MSNVLPEFIYGVATEVPNDKNPEQPLLSLPYTKIIREKKVEKSHRIGVKKAYEVLAHFDDIMLTFLSYPENPELFEYELVVMKGTQYEQKFYVTSFKLAIYNHYRKEMQEYVDKYYVPFTPAREPCELIEIPKVVREVRDLDVVPVLYLPCYEPREEDTGTGLGPFKMTKKKIDFIVGTEFGEKWLSEFRKFKSESKPGDTLKHEYIKKDGTTGTNYYPYEVVCAIIKYRNVMTGFAMNPDAPLDLDDD